MPESSSTEGIFLAHLPFLERVLTGASRTLSLRGDDADEFRSWAQERILENDYAVIRKWRGDSKLTTYLTTVVINLGREFRVRRDGRWRPSAAAERVGPVAIRLERLLYRDGWSLAEATALLRSREETDLSDRQIAELSATFPVRHRRRSETRELDMVPSDNGADASDLVLQEEHQLERARISELLASAIASLAPTAQTVIRMHFLHGRNLADVGRALSTQQKPLYRLKDNALRELRHRLEASGVAWEDLRELLGGAMLDVSAELPTPDPRLGLTETPATGELPAASHSNFEGSGLHGIEAADSLRLGESEA